MADIDRDLIFTRLPPDSGVVTPIAPLDEEPDQQIAAQLDKMRLALPSWEPGQVPDPGAARPQLLFVAAVPDVFQMQDLERSCRSSSTTTDSGGASRKRTSSRSSIGSPRTRSMETTSAVDELRPLGFINGPADMDQTRDRSRVYAVKLLGRITGRYARNGSRVCGSRQSEVQSTIGQQSESRVAAAAKSEDQHDRKATTLPTVARHGRICGSRASASARGRSAAAAGRSRGASGRRPVARGDAPRDRARRELDRHGGGVRPGTLRGAGRAAARRDCPQRSAVCLHQVRPDVGRARPRRGRQAGRPAGIHPARDRSVARAARRRADRSLSVALAGGRRHADRGLLADAARPEARGKVRAVGLSNHKVEQLERAEPLGHVDTLQPPFSPIRRDVAAAELPWCAAHGTGVIVYSPMQSGLLTGSFTEARAAALRQDDWRSRSPEFQPPKLQATSRWPTRSDRSPRVTARPSAPSLSPGRSRPGRHRRHRRRAQPAAGRWLDSPTGREPAATECLGTENLQSCGTCELQFTDSTQTAGEHGSEAVKRNNV